MKRPILFAFAFLHCYCSVRAYAQQSPLHGIITVQNSQFERGEVEFVQFAEVDEKSQPSKGHALTDAKGQWRMEIVGIPEKEPVSLLIRKEGYQVVNTDVLQATAGQIAALRIYMASNKYITDAKRRYYNTGYTEAEKNLTQKLNAKTKEIIALQERANDNQEKINILQEETTLLQSQYEKLDQLAHDLADKYARINLDDAGPLYQNAFRLFQAGDLDGAMQLWRNADLNGQINDVLEEEKRIGLLKAEVTERDSVKTRRKDDLMQNLQLKADAHRLRFEWDSLGAVYGALLRLDSTNFNILNDYLSFLHEQQQFVTAIHYAEKSLSFTKNPDQKVTLLYHLVNSYEVIDEARQAEKTLLDLEAILRNRQEKTRHFI